MPRTTHELIPLARPGMHLSHLNSSFSPRCRLLVCCSFFVVRFARAIGNVASRRHGRRSRGRGEGASRRSLSQTGMRRAGLWGVQGVQRRRTTRRRTFTANRIESPGEGGMKKAKQLPSCHQLSVIGLALFNFSRKLSPIFLSHIIIPHMPPKVCTSRRGALPLSWLSLDVQREGVRVLNRLFRS